MRAAETGLPVAGRTVLAADGAAAAAEAASGAAATIAWWSSSEVLGPAVAPVGAVALPATRTHGSDAGIAGVS